MLWSCRTVIMLPEASRSTLWQCEIPFGSAAQFVSERTSAVVVDRVGIFPFSR